MDFSPIQAVQSSIHELESSPEEATHASPGHRKARLDTIDRLLACADDLGADGAPLRTQLEVLRAEVEPVPEDFHPETIRVDDVPHDDEQTTSSTENSDTATKVDRT